MTSKNKSAFIGKVALAAFALCFLFGLSETQAAEPDIFFFQPSLVNEKYSPDELREEFGLLKELGVKTVIFEFTEFSGKTYYPSKAFGGGVPKMLSAFIDMAEEFGMDVYIGVGMRGNWPRFNNKDKADKGIFIAERKKLKTIIDELYPRFGKRENVKGWYIPHDFAAVWITDEEMTGFYKDVVNDIKTATKGGTVLISPWIGRDVWNDKTTASNWKHFLSIVKPDVVILQDNASQPYTSFKTTVEYLKKLSPTFRESKVQLWIDIEAYAINEKRSLVPADPKRFIQQIEEETPYADGATVFDITHYMNPNRGKAAKDLFTGYKAWRATPKKK